MCMRDMMPINNNINYQQTHVCGELPACPRYFGACVAFYFPSLRCDRSRPKQPDLKTLTNE